MGFYSNIFLGIACLSVCSFSTVSQAEVIVNSNSPSGSRQVTTEISSGSNTTSRTGTGNAGGSGDGVKVENPNGENGYTANFEARGGGDRASGAVVGLTRKTEEIVNKDSKDDSQEGYERETHEKKTAAGNAANSAGGAQKALGIMQIAMGTALLPWPTTPAGVALIASGIMNMMQGNKGQQGARDLLNDARIAHGYATDFDTVNPGTGSADLGSGRSSIDLSDDLLQVDQSLYGPEADAMFNKFEEVTGIPRDEYFAALKNGEDMFDIAARAKGVNMSADELRAYASDLEGEPPPENKDELDENLSGVLAEINSNADLQYGGASGREVASADTSGASTVDFNALYGKKKEDDKEGTDINKLNADLAARISGYGKFSPELQARLASEGFNSKSIFQMVREQYKTKTPTMLGLDQPSVLDKALMQALDI